MGKSSGGGDQTTTSEPWDGVKKYLTGSGGKTTTALRPGAVPTGYSGGYTGGGGDSGDWWNPRANPIYAPEDYITTTTPGTPGIYGEAQRLYQEGGWSPQMQGVTDQWVSALQGRSGANADYSQGILDRGNSLLAGDGSQLDLTAARAAQGALDPTAALSQILSGNVNNPYLDQQIANLGKDLSSNFMENVAPGLRSGAMAAGGFGGSRQGIAEGLGTQGVTDALSTQAANIRSTAYENAQNRMQSTAQALNDQAATVGQNNINNRLNATQVGAALIGTGTQMKTADQAAEDARYRQMLALLGAGDAYNWGNLGNYASIVSPGAGVGGVSTLTGGGGSNPAAGAAGGALAGYGLAQGTALGGPWGAAIGGGLGLLSSL